MTHVCILAAVMIAQPAPTFILCNPGDVNDDGRVDISDPIYTLMHLFRAGPPPVFPQSIFNQIAGHTLVSEVFVSTYFVDEVREKYPEGDTVAVIVVLGPLKGDVMTFERRIIPRTSEEDDPLCITTGTVRMGLTPNAIYLDWHIEQSSCGAVDDPVRTWGQYILSYDRRSNGYILEPTLSDDYFGWLVCSDTVMSGGVGCKPSPCDRMPYCSTNLALTAEDCPGPVYYSETCK